MKILLFWIIIVLVITVWVVWGHDWLKRQPWRWSQRFFNWLDPIELVLWKKSKTILFARTKMVTGVLLSILQTVGELNIVPLMPLIPDQYEDAVQIAFNLLPLSLTIIGMIDERLRNVTAAPIELVAIGNRELKSNPELRAAVEMADETQEAAIAKKGAI